MRDLLITGGAPRVGLDAVRHMTVAATGTTTRALSERLQRVGISADRLLAVDAAADPAAQRYADRAELDRALEAWIRAHPEGVVVMTAAVNDYRCADITVVHAERESRIPAGGKIPSRADEVRIRLVPAPKLIDQFPGWGHRGPVVACKYEGADTVVASAEALRRRIGAAFVIANSIDGRIQSVVDADGETPCPDREALLDAVAERLAALVRS